jgi:hypothetical protein
MEGFQSPIGTLKIIAAIEHPTVITKILAHLGLSARAPPQSPARPFDAIPNGLTLDRFPLPSGSAP